jgi:hypothetical protein
VTDATDDPQDGPMTERPVDPNEPDARPIEVDGSVARPARVYDYVLGGRDNFASDRATAEHASAVSPGGIDHARAAVRAERAFVERAVRYVVADMGIRQFLDVGTGIPSTVNIHEIAQDIASDARIVYVDDDAVVLAHAHTLRKSTADGATAYIDGDIRDPEPILRLATKTLDLAQPVAVTLFGTLHHFAAEDRPYEVVARLIDAVPPGSYLVLTHLTPDILTDEVTEAAKRVNEQTGFRLILRTRDEVSRFFDGLELVDPGVVHVDEWRPGGTPVSDGWVTPYYGAVGRKA